MEVLLGTPTIITNNVMKVKNSLEQAIEKMFHRGDIYLELVDGASPMECLTNEYKNIQYLPLSDIRSNLLVPLSGKKQFGSSYTTYSYSTKINIFGLVIRPNNSY